MMKAVIAVVVFVAMAEMALAQTNSTMAPAVTTQPPGNATACTAQTNACKAAAKGITTNITSLISDLTKGGIRDKIKNLCKSVTNTCWTTAANSADCRGIPDVAKKFTDDITIPSICSGGGQIIPNIVVALTAFMAAILLNNLFE